MLASLGASYRDGASELIAKLSAGNDEPAIRLTELGRRLGSAAIVGTCNRFEVYTSSPIDQHEFVTALSLVTKVPAAEIESGLRLRRGHDASRHLYEVASGLDSMSLGEHEVLGQIRTAWSTAVEVRTDDPVLAHLFHGALRTGRRVRAETAIARNAPSISALAAAEAADVHPALTDAEVLIIGAGDAGRSAAMAMRARGVTRLKIANRSPERAVALAEAVAGEPVPFEGLHGALRQSEVVISGTSSPRYVLDHAMVTDAVQGRGDQPLLAIDIAVPRDIDPAVGTIPGVAYRSVEDLRDVATRTGCGRALEVPRAQLIVDEELEKLARWWDARDAIPTISALTASAESIRRAQIARGTRQMELSDDDRRQLDLMTRALVKQLLHKPIVALRESSDCPASVEAVRTLFDLDTPAPV